MVQLCGKLVFLIDLLQNFMFLILILCILINYTSIIRTGCFLLLDKKASYACVVSESKCLLMSLLTDTGNMVYGKDMLSYTLKKIWFTQSIKIIIPMIGSLLRLQGLILN